jgi:signal peptidase I
VQRKSFSYKLAKNFVLLALFIIFIFEWVIMPVRIVGDSMYPNLKDHEVGVSFIAGKHFGYERFDVVIVEQQGELIIKRIIGLPNETLEYKNNQLYINNKPVSEPFLETEYRKQVDRSSKLPFTYPINKVQLGKDEYFVMGDNRPRSQDSRYFGPLHEDEILSKGFWVIYLEN